VSGLIWIVILLWVVLMVFLAAGTLWFQGYIYSEPVEGILWRAPAAGTILTLVVVWWCYLDYRAPGHYPALFDLALGDEKEFTELWVPLDGKLVRFELKKDAAGHSEYLDAARRPLPRRPNAIIVKEDGEEDRFEPERNEKGYFKVTPGQPLHYVDPQGRVMTDDAPGRITESRTGRFIANVLLNILNFLAWFGCLWLLLRFQWAHAFGLAVVFWLVMTLLIFPMLLRRVEETARRQAVLESAAATKEVPDAWLDANRGHGFCGASSTWTWMSSPTTRTGKQPILIRGLSAQVPSASRNRQPCQKQVTTPFSTAPSLNEAPMCGHTSSMAKNCPFWRNRAISLLPTSTALACPSARSLTRATV
jgi:hypothetical protein